MWPNNNYTSFSLLGKANIFATMEMLYEHSIGLGKCIFTKCTRKMSRGKQILFVSNKDRIIIEDKNIRAILLYYGIHPNIDLSCYINIYSKPGQ